MAETILCCFAHPDDESFGVGAILARAVAEGNRVVLVTATPGDAGFLPPEAAAAGLTQAEIRGAELRNAAAALGIQRLELLDYRDGHLAEVPPDDLVARLRAVAAEESPAVILTFGPNGITGHADHKAISRAATRLFYELERAGTCKALFFAALPKEAAAGMGLEGVEADPNTEVDTAAYLDAQIRALRCHASQPDAREHVEMLERDRPGTSYLYRAFPAIGLTERSSMLIAGG
jgi:LmbE family N-acetylglucosaminyl deacetylase